MVRVQHSSLALALNRSILALNLRIPPLPIPVLMPIRPIVIGELKHILCWMCEFIRIGRIPSLLHIYLSYFIELVVRHIDIEPNRLAY